MVRVFFLRGVNAGAKNRVPLKEVASRFSEQLRCRVENYLQSGNLVVADNSAISERVRPELEKLLGEDYQLEVPIIERSHAELVQLLVANSWADQDPTRVHLSMWENPALAELLEAMKSADWSGDQINFVANNAWMFYATEFKAAKLGSQVIEKKLKVVATARNLRTIENLVKIGEELSA